jgi:hypothetical protein
MARARNLKPSFFTDAELLECPFWVRLLFEGLWVHADRRGILADSPKQIKIDIFPADDVDIESGLTELAAHGLIERYVAKGKRCILILSFGRHQNPHKDEQPNHLPSKEECEQDVPPVQTPGKQDANPDDSLVLPLSPESLLAESLIDDGAGAPAVRYSREFESFWSEWSKPPSKGHGTKKEAYDSWKSLGLDARGRDAARQEVIDGLHRWQQTRKWRDGYVRDCFRWLKARGWADDVPDEVAPRAGPQPKQRFGPNDFANAKV